MKIVIVTHGKYAEDKLTSLSEKEVYLMYKALKKQGNDVKILTLLRKNYNYGESAPDILDITTEKYNINDYDIMIFGESAAYHVYYAGQPDAYAEHNYWCAAHFKGKIYTVIIDYIDTIILKPLTNSFFEKCERIQNRKLNESDYDITGKSIGYITQFKNKEQTLEHLKKTRPMFNHLDVTYFPLYKFAMWMPDSVYKLDEHIPSNSEKEFDLIYGGMYRDGSRKDKMLEFYSDYPEDIKVYMFGRDIDKLGKFSKNIEFGKPVKNSKFLAENQRGLATIIIGDKEYNDVELLSGRIYECIRANIVTFIDKDYVPTCPVYKDSWLKDFLYIADKNEAIEKIRMLKNDNDLYQKVIKLQREDTYEPLEKYELLLQK